jgi:hypothetical protein
MMENNDEKRFYVGTLDDVGEGGLLHRNVTKSQAEYLVGMSRRLDSALEYRGTNVYIVEEEIDGLTKEAFLTQLANEGNTNAQYVLGRSPMVSVGDMERLKWLSMAAKNGHEGAKHELDWRVLYAVEESFGLLVEKHPDLKEHADYLTEFARKPKADVVTCGECKHWAEIENPRRGKSFMGCRFLENSILTVNDGSVAHLPTESEFFCANGERKDVGCS